MEEYIKIFALHNVRLIYDNTLLHAIAKKAIKDNTGARNLRTIVHKLFSEIIFTMPSTYNQNNQNNNKFLLHVNNAHLENKEKLIIEIDQNNLLEEKEQLSIKN